MIDYKNKLFVLYDREKGTVKLGRVWKVQEDYYFCMMTRAIDIQSNKPSSKHPLSEFKLIAPRELEALPLAAWIIDKHPKSHSVQVDIAPPNATQTDFSSSSVPIPEALRRQWAKISKKYGIGETESDELLEELWAIVHRKEESK